MKQNNFLRCIYAVVFAAIFTQVSSQVVDSSVYKNFNPSIIEKVYNVVSKTTTPLTPNKQVAFANFFKQSDSTIASYIKKGKHKKFIDSIKALSLERFDSLFSATEKFQYYTSRKDVSRVSPIPYSQFSLAIKFKDSLGLSESITEALMAKSDTLKKMQDAFYAQNPNKKFDSKAFESETLSNILTEAQHTKLLIIKNKKSAINSAVNDWNELEKRGLTNGHNKDTTIIQLTNFYLARQSAYDRYAHDKIQQSTNVKMIYDNKPAALNALMHARRNPNNDTIGQSFQW
jgi:hypothetical protein